MSTSASAGGGVSLADRKRTVLASLAIDIILLIPEIVLAVLSMSVVLFADAMKCANETLVTFFAYIVIRKMAKGGAGAYDYGMGKSETGTSVITTAVIFISLTLVILGAVYRIARPVRSSTKAPISVHA